MASQYTIPIHLCQWCYKKGGVYIIDCLCVVCKKCYANKGEWFTQPEKCFCCNKKTNRRFIDMKESPQEGSFYYQNISNQIKNLGKVQQFQQEINRKYCKHLSKKVQKYEQTINRFVQQFPQHLTFFQNAYYQIQEKHAPTIRSKSLQSDLNNDDHVKHLYPSHSEKSLSTNSQLQQKFVQKRQKKASKKDSNFEHEYSANPYQSSVAGRTSNYSDFDSFGNHGLMNQNVNPNVNPSINPNVNPNFNPQKKMLYQSVKNSQASSKSSFRQDPSRSMLNQNMQKKSMQVANNNQFYRNSMQEPFPVYKIGGNKKLSDPSKQINLNNINMQTALRSIKSDDEKCPPPFHQNNNGESRRKFAQRNIVTNQMQQYEETYNPQYRTDFNRAQQKRFPK